MYYTDVNKRAVDMWKIISQEIDFRKKFVIDLGCGYGEFLWRAEIAGASVVVGVDKENKTGVPILNFDLNDPKRVGFFNSFDIAFCFSVLPYLDDISETLWWLTDTFPLCLIEAQYEPEPYNIGVSNDADMKRLLLLHFNKVKPIGHTIVQIKERGYPRRTIWRCE